MSTPIPDAYRPEATRHLRGSLDGAHCEGVDMTTTGRTDAEIRDLKLHCVGCPVNKRCGQWAVSLGGREDVDQVAGGMTREERTQVRTVLNARRAARAARTQEVAA